MRRVAILASFMLAFLLVVVGSSGKTTVLHRTAYHHRVTRTAGCPKTYTVRMALRAADGTFAGTRDVSQADWRRLFRYQRCQRNPHAKQFVAWDRHRDFLGWRERRNPPMSVGLASWYDDGGATASGWHSTYGVAVCGSAGPCFSFGTRILFRYGGRQVVATVDDHGPYAGGRNFDLNQNTAQALGFGGVGMVEYHVL